MGKPNIINNPQPVQPARPTVFVPDFPYHSQDTKYHCGVACAMMVVDWLNRGGDQFDHPPGRMSQVRMHRSVAQGQLHGKAGCTPMQLCDMINTGRQPNELRAEWFHGTPDAVRAMAVESLSKHVPVIALFGSDAHWVVLVGKTWHGWMLHDPAAHGPLYSDASCVSQTGANHVIISDPGHQRKQPKCCSKPDTPGTYEGYMADANLMKVRTVDGMVHLIFNGFTEADNLPDFMDGEQHLVILRKPTTAPHPLPGGTGRPAIVIRPPAVDFNSPRWAAVAWELLEKEGLAGTRALPKWKNATMPGQPTTVPLKGRLRGTFLYWRETSEHHRIAARFDPQGHLAEAAVLSNWPDMKTPGATLEWFQTNGAAACAAAGLRISLPEVQSAVSPELHWEPCEQSLIPWWPFYEITITPRTGERRDRRLIYLDPAGKVHLSLTKLAMTCF